MKFRALLTIHTGTNVRVQFNKSIEQMYIRATIRILFKNKLTPLQSSNSIE